MFSHASDKSINHVAYLWMTTDKVIPLHPLTLSPGHPVTIWRPHHGTQ